MEYEDYISKSEYRKLEKQLSCHHSTFQVMIRCKKCGKLNTFETKELSSITSLVESFFCCSDSPTDKVLVVESKNAIVYHMETEVVEGALFTDD